MSLRLIERICTEVVLAILNGSELVTESEEFEELRNKD